MNKIMDSIKIKAVIYCRVSSKEQEDTGYSLPAQEKYLKEYAERADKNFGVVKIFQVSESAGGKFKRKIFNEMMEYVKKNNIKIIICEKVDRFTRNFKDAVMIDDWLEEDEEREVHLVKDALILHKNSRSQEKLNWGVRILFAKNYIDNLSEEVKKGQKEKLEQGWIPMRAKLGYKTEGEKGHKIHIVDKWVVDENGNKVLAGEAKHMKWMFEQYATGNYSLARLEKELYEAGMRTRAGGKLGMSRIHIMLQDPFYYGKNEWKGQLYEGEQEHLIGKDLFDKVQTILKRQFKNPQLRKHNSLFRGKIFCEHCGGMLTWYTKKGHWYGHCNNHGEYAKCPKKTCMRQERVEEQYLDVFEIIAPKNEEILAEIENILREEYAGKVTTREQEVMRLNGLLGNIRKQKDKYFEAKINREVDMEYCEKRIAEVTAEEEALENSLALVSDKHDEFLYLGLAAHELAFKSKEIYEKANIDEKRLLLSQLFTNLIQDEHKIKPNYTKAADFLLNWIPKLNQNYELAKIGSNKGKTDDFASVSPVWLALLNDFRHFDYATAYQRSK